MLALYGLKVECFLSVGKDLERKAYNLLVSIYDRKDLERIILILALESAWSMRIWMDQVCLLICLQLLQ